MKWTLTLINIQYKNSLSQYYYYNCVYSRWFAYVSTKIDCNLLLRMSLERIFDTTDEIAVNLNAFLLTNKFKIISYGHSAIL